MTNIKAAILGGLVALLGVVAGEGIARADCDYAPQTEGVPYSLAMADVLEGAGKGYNCEVIQLQDGSFEAQCDEVSSPLESAACSEWAHGFGVGEDDADEMYEACMVIALHTGAVK